MLQHLYQICFGGLIWALPIVRDCSALFVVALQRQQIQKVGQDSRLKKGEVHLQKSMRSAPLSGSAGVVFYRRALGPRTHKATETVSVPLPSEFPAQSFSINNEPPN